MLLFFFFFKQKTAYDMRISDWSSDVCSCDLNAVNYGLHGQDAAGLAFGEWRQTQPPRLADDIAGLVGKGVDVYYVQDDAVARGISESALVEDLKPIPRNGLAALLGAYDQVWHW